MPGREGEWAGEANVSSKIHSSVSATCSIPGKFETTAERSYVHLITCALHIAIARLKVTFETMTGGVAASLLGSFSGTFLGKKTGAEKSKCETFFFADDVCHPDIPAGLLRESTVCA